MLYGFVNAVLPLQRNLACADQGRTDAVAGSDARRKRLLSIEQDASTRTVWLDTRCHRDAEVAQPLATCLLLLLLLLSTSESARHLRGAQRPQVSSSTLFVKRGVLGVLMATVSSHAASPWTAAASIPTQPAPGWPG